MDWVCHFEGIEMLMIILNVGVLNLNFDFHIEIIFGRFFLKYFIINVGLGTILTCNNRTLCFFIEVVIFFFNNPSPNYYNSELFFSYP
ncbi:hypothetical protein GGR42_002589 [Saonia flava]|uniref:Uncharacterized protein n=1 Tax=Saonia flava TaxID=523696 RepID=A0A846QVS8_9FLAO|nr:hypothetical protein [Saonia flava]